MRATVEITRMYVFAATRVMMAGVQQVTKVAVEKPPCKRPRLVYLRVTGVGAGRHRPRGAIIAGLPEEHGADPFDTVQVEDLAE